MVKFLFAYFIHKMASSSGAYIPEGVNLTKAKVKRKKNNDWSWEDEALMYDITHKQELKKKRLVEKESMTEEMKKLKKEAEINSLYMREERKLFLGGLSPETVEKVLKCKPIPSQIAEFNSVLWRRRSAVCIQPLP